MYGFPLFLEILSYGWCRVNIINKMMGDSHRKVYFSSNVDQSRERVFWGSNLDDFVKNRYLIKNDLKIMVPLSFGVSECFDRFKSWDWVILG